MQRSTLLFLLVACTAVAVVLTFAFSQSNVGVEPPTPVHGNGSVSGSGATAGDEMADGNEPADSQQGSDGGYQGEVPEEAPHVQITVTPLERFVAPPSQPQLAESVDGTPLSARILAGVGAGFDAMSDRRGVTLLAVEVPGGQVLRQLAVAPTTSAMARIGARIVLRGQVVDAAQQPVQAANVWFGELAADGSQRLVAVDETGAFQADVPAGDGVPFVVRAPGFASTWRTITVDPQAQPLLEVLRPATSLSVQLAVRADELARVRAFVVPLGRVSTGVSQWPFFLQCLSGGYALDETGQVRIDDLPQHGEVGVVVRHPLAPTTPPVKAKLSEQLVRVIVPVTFAASRLLGAVVDDSGNAIASASVWVRSPEQPLGSLPSMRLLPPHLDLHDACFDVTGMAGQFVIGVADEQQLLLSVRANGYAGRDLSPRSMANAAVVLPTWIGGEPSLRILPPMAGEVWRVSINLGGGINTACAADDALLVSLPHAGRFSIEITVAVAGRQLGERVVKEVMVTGLLPIETAAPK
jgi:hypothetical protein